MIDRKNRLGSVVKNMLKYNHTSGLYSFIDLLKKGLDHSDRGDDIKKHEECKKKKSVFMDTI